MLASHDAQGFRAPFAALVLAEVARTDRITPWLSAEEREALVQGAAYQAAEFDRLARPVLFVAQRGLHSSCCPFATG